MKLFKSISAALKDKMNAKHLKLTLNSKDATQNGISDELYQLNNLEQLLLISKNDIEVNQNISNLINLDTINIQSAGEVTISGELFRIKTLKSIKIKCKKLNLQIVAMPSSPVENLIIPDCNLEQLPPQIFELTTIKVLNIAGNRLSELPSYIKELTKLTRLTLDRNQLQVLPTELEEIKTLAHLSVDGNKFDQKEKARIQNVYNIWFA